MDLAEKNTIAEIRYCRDCGQSYIYKHDRGIVGLSFCPTCVPAKGV